MIKRLKHLCLGHDYYAAWVCSDAYKRTTVAFVCKCGSSFKLQLPGSVKNHDRSGDSIPAPDKELEDLKRMAGLS